MSGKIDVLLVDDHAVVRAGYRLLLSQAATIDRIFEAGSGEEACRRYVEDRPDIVVMDLSMAGIGGLNAIQRIRARDTSARILVFSIHDEAIYINKALEAGASGYISKRSAPDIMVDAVVRIARGERYVEDGLEEPEGRGLENTPHRNTAVNNLSSREFEVFLRVAEGLTTRDIAEQLCISYKTVANYRTAIKAKLDAQTDAEIARLAYSLELLKK